MKIFTLFLCLGAICLLGCHQTGRKKQEEKIRQQLQGEWELVNDHQPTTIERMNVLQDSIEFCCGYFEMYEDSMTQQKRLRYLGHYATYRVHHDSIFIKSPLDSNWEFTWKFGHLKNDTLELMISDTLTVKYRRLVYNMDTLPEFDHIIYSSSGCFGTCPVMNVAIDITGNVAYWGERYFEPLGFYTGKMDTLSRDDIFTRFRKIDPLRLSDNYTAAVTDNEFITITFVRDGKMVKTIRDYAHSGPEKLQWTYPYMVYLNTRVSLNNIPPEEPFYPPIYFFKVKNKNEILPLEKSECFYLWTEMKKGVIIDTALGPLPYSTSFRRNNTYIESNTSVNKHDIRSIETDGRYFVFLFYNKSRMVYDLGYNFIERNFTPSDFRKPFQWER